MLDTELKYLRDRDLYEVYKDGLQEGRFPSMRDAAEYVCLQPAPRFYVTARTAGCYVGMIESGVSLIGLHSLSRRRAWEIYDRYVHYLAEHPDCREAESREAVLERIVEEGAPQFYVSAETARKILQSENRRIRSNSTRFLYR